MWGSEISTGGQPSFYHLKQKIKVAFNQATFKISEVVN